MKKKIYQLLSILMVLSLLPPTPKIYALSNLLDLSTNQSVNELNVSTNSSALGIESDAISTYAVSVSPKENVFPIRFSQKGLLIYNYEYMNTNPIGTYGDFAIYSNIECTKQIQYSPYNGFAIIPTKGTYYLKFSVRNSQGEIPEDGFLFSLSFQFVDGGNRVLKNKIWSAVGIPRVGDEVYFKVTTAKAGSLSLNIESDSSVYITLLDSSKKEISEEVYDSSIDGKISFAVEKGTYYIKARTYTDYYRLRYTLKSVTKTSGTTKVKAKNLTKGKLYNGLFTATDKKGAVAWYKITLNKTQPIKITYKGSVSSGYITLKFFGNGIGGSITQKLNEVDENRSFSVKTYASPELPKGTYYIKVTKSTQKTSGAYYLRYN
jgi:hypothetical protein